MMKRNKEGFTLIELMITVAIVAILLAVALPSYQNQVAASRRADGQGALTGFAQAMERYFTENATYTGAAAGGANTGAPAIYPTQAPLDGATKFYNLTINAATATTYIVRATPIGAQTGDGVLELRSTGERFWNGNAGW